MNIEGTYTLQATPEVVWRCLMEQQLILRTISGVERVEKLDADTYTISLHIKYPALQGTHTGRILLSEQQPPHHYRMTITGEGEQSPISGSGSLSLHQFQNSTVVAYKGALNVGKRGSQVSPKIVKGAAKLFIQQFFTALAEQLKQQGAVEGVAVGNDLMVLPLTDSSHTVFYRIAHLLRLGRGNPVQEIRWERRLRRASILSGLLMLVWVGTRIPQRKR